MNTTLEDAERLYAVAKSLLAEHRKYARLCEKAHAAQTPKQSQKANVDLNWQAFHICGIEHAFHAAAVDANLADLREPDHYRTYSVKLTGFHEYQQVPAKPRAYRAEVA